MHDWRGRPTTLRFPHTINTTDNRSEPTAVPLGATVIGGGRFTIIAGPCSVEDHGTMHSIATAVRAAGADGLRGGAYKPRTSPYEFQGLGERGITILEQVQSETGLPVVTEVMDPVTVAAVAPRVSMLQIGSRNMQNIPLLRAAGRTSTPILLKRGFQATLEEWLAAAEYIIDAGNPHVVLCERGIRTFETYTRNTLDLAAVVALKQLTHLPVLVDPSHATGRRELVPALCCAALAAGADGIIVEVHPDPAAARTDGPQTIDLDRFTALVTRLRALEQFLHEEREEREEQEERG